MTISRNLASFANNLDASGNIAGVNISLANVSGTLAVANGGSGLAAPGLSGNVLTSNGTAFISSAPAVAAGGSGLFNTSISSASSTAVDIVAAQ